MGSPVWALLLLMMMMISLDWTTSLDNGAARLPPLGCAFRCSARRASSQVALAAGSLSLTD